MADPPHFSLFQHRLTTGLNPVLMLDDEFSKNHTKVLLRSDASDRVWEVKLDGDKLAGGWKEFADANYLRDGDVLDFKHGGDENFHVSVFSGSNFGDDNTDTEDSYSDDDDVDAIDDDDNIENISVNRKKKPEEDSSSSHFCLIRACVTRYSLKRDRLDFSKDFKIVSFEEDNKLSEIDLVNKQGRRWTLPLAKNRSSGVFFITRGWRNFCIANELSQGDKCKFKVVENGEKPVLLLCPQDSGYSHEEEGPVANEMNCSLGEASKGKEKKKKNPSTFLTLKLTPNRYKNGQLYISSEFTRNNDIKKSGEIILKDKYGRKWSSYLQISGGGWFYLRRGWREMCEANEVKVNDSFVLELIWEDAKLVFKFFSKIENNGEGNKRTRKKRACETVEKTHREFQEDDQTITNSRKLRRTQPKGLSVSDQVANVKRSIVDTLNTVRQFRLELETREQNLEASLMEIDALGEKILGIGKIFNNTLF